MTRLTTLITLLALGLSLAFSAAAKEQLTDDQVRQLVIQESVAAYHATGHPCACPYDAARNGSSCGGRSAYSRPGGPAPLCYPTDVTAGTVRDWRAALNKFSSTLTDSFRCHRWSGGAPRSPVGLPASQIALPVA
jgi:hypothetical protein